MRTYRVVWAMCCGLVLAPLCLAGLIAGGLVVALLAAACVGALAALITEDGDRTSRAAWSGAGAAAVVTSAVAVGALATLSVAALMAATSPVVLRAVSRAVRRGHRTATAQPDVGEPPAVQTFETLVGALDDSQLCRAWRSSWEVLAQTTDVASRLELVTLRQVYLDELQRRHPAGFTAWLDSGAGPLGDPSRYLAGPGADTTAPRRDEAGPT
jgi:hypothetical protein